MPHQRDSVAYAELVLFAIAVDGEAVDELHDEIRKSRAGDAAVDQACDSRMVEAGQELPFAAEAFLHIGRRQRQRHYFNGSRHLESPVGALRQIDDAHTAAAQQACGLPLSVPRKHLGCSRSHFG